MKPTKSIICAILASVLILLMLAGCKDNSLPVDDVIADGEIYDVVRSGDDYYILSDKKSSDDDTDSCEVAGVCFESVEEMRIAILDNKVSDYKIQKLRSENHLKSGEPLPIFDLNKMYQPTSTNILEIEKAVWYGPYYIVTFTATDGNGNKASGSGGIDTKETFEQTYNKRFKEDLENLGDNYVVNQLTDRNATEYRSHSSKYVVYTLESEGQKIHIMERYRTKASDFVSQASETVPWIVYMHVETDGLYYSFGFIDFTSRPTEEWLLSFGMEPYVPEESASATE